MSRSFGGGSVVVGGYALGMDTSTDDFRIKDLGRDRDALILFGLSAVLVLLAVAGLVFLSDAQWDRLVNRSKILWVAGLAAVPTIVAIYQRYQLRRTSAKALGVAAAGAPLPLLLEGGDVEGEPLENAASLSNPPAEPADLVEAALPDDTPADGEEVIDYGEGQS